MASKRASVGAAGPEPKRQCQAVAKALRSAGHLSDVCRDMLGSMAPSALMTYQVDRHAYENDIVNMVNQTLSNIERDMIQNRKDTEGRIGNAPAEKEARAAARDAAESDVQVKADAVKVAATAALESETALNAAQAALAKSVKEENRSNAERTELIKKKESLEAVRTEALTPLKDGTLEKKATKQPINRLAGACKTSGVEKAVVSAACDGLAQTPADRSSFLQVAVDQLEQRLSAISSGLAEQVTTATSARDARAAEAQTARTAKEEAKAIADSRSNEHKAAQAAHKAAKDALKAAENACKNYFSDMKKVMDGFDKSKDALEEFRSTVLVAFKELELLAAPPPPVEPVAALEEAPMPVESGEPAASIEA